ncbi:hypothetical protein N7492_005029 [Penicillium capsulatum]|uniref:Pre-rRNA processing protein n=1 Tax=Penicillium capsulatum TaxID=69766 RepID=A0A9W9LRA1_9EURO|nr:hypothetical protein N7492_005029 [Penicillium capsulatum]KAJ6135862.1 hypothetical protein N7512_001022 [Penicillium capsulatum]
MTDEASRPLLDEQATSSAPNPSQEIATRSDPRGSFELSSESTPLLHRRDDDLVAYGTDRDSSPSSSIESRRSGSPGSSCKKTGRVRWPTVLSLALLTTSILAILLFAFAAPAVIKEYAQEAAVFEPTALSIDSTTSNGVRARVQGDFVMDSNRVKGKSIRTFGRFATWISREIDTGDSDVEVYLPEYGNILVGNAALPSIKVNIRNGHHTKIDFLTDLTPGDLKGIHGVAMDWIEGRLGRLSVKGKATLHLKAGLINLGTQILTDTFTFEENDLPALPEINVAKLSMHDAKDRAVAVDVLLSAVIDSPVALAVPALGFDIFVPNCSPGDPHIQVANAQTAEVQIHPGEPTIVGVEGLVRSLPDSLTATCPGEDGSPLDLLVASFIRGLKTTIYVRGADMPSSQAPEWMVDLLRSVTVPLSFTGHALDNLVKNFTMTDTHFSLPDPFAEPDTPESQPAVSALVKVLIALPKQLNFNIDVPRVRSLANVYYKDKVLGVLDINKWHKANSTLVKDRRGSSGLLVEFAIKDAPLEVTDSDLLADLVQTMLFGSGGVMLHITATVDTKVSTGLGLFTVRGIPTEGDVPVKTPSGDSIGHLHPRVVSLQMAESTESSLFVSTKVNFTNPTEYSATIPLVDVLMIYNGTTIAHVLARDISVVPGNNTNVSIEFAWSPSEYGGRRGIENGRALLSSYISGANTTVTLQTHKGTIPALPEIGKSLSIIHIAVPVPRVSTPGSPDDGGDRPHFIQDATFYLWSSTAEFTLFSPLAETTIAITSIDATAFYEKDEPVGRINYKESFNVPPGLSQTPRLPVDPVVGGIGYDALRKALGQSLQMDAVARVGVCIEKYTDEVFYHGKGIAAKVRI